MDVLKDFLAIVFHDRKRDAKTVLIFLNRPDFLIKALVINLVEAVAHRICDEVPLSSDSTLLNIVPDFGQALIVIDCKPHTGREDLDAVELNFLINP